MLALFDDGEVEAHPDDDEEEEEVKEHDHQQRLLQHHHAREVVLDVEVVDVTLNQVGLAECDDRTAGDVQVREVQRVRLPLDGIRRDKLQVLAAFREDDFRHQLVHRHVVEDVIHQPHLQHVRVAVVEQILEAGHVVADGVVRAPSAEQREPRAEIQLDGVLQHLHRRRGDVAVGVAVVNARRRGWQDGFVRLDAGGAAARVLLVIVTRERAFQDGAGMDDVDGFLHRNVAPVRHLDGPLQTGDGHERRVVLVVDHDVVLGVG